MKSTALDQTSPEQPDDLENNEDESSQLKAEFAAAAAGLFGLLMVAGFLAIVVGLAVAFHLSDHHAVLH